MQEDKLLTPLNETDLRQSLSELEAIYDDVPLGLALVGADFRYRRINAKLAEMNGLPAEAHIGRTIREMVPKIADAGEEVIRRIVATGQPLLNLEIEGETSAEPGVLRSFKAHWLPLKGPDGKVEAVSFVTEEVTAQRQAERQLRESEHRLATALRAGQLGVFEYSFRNPSRYFWDRTVRQIWGVGETEVITDRHFWDTLHPDDAPRIAQSFERILKQREPSRVDVEYRILRFSDQELRWVSVALDVVCDDAGPVKMIGTIQDITARKQAEEHAHLLMREVNHRSKNLLSVVQSIAHQTARSADPASFATRFSERLSALAASHDLLVHSQWKGVGMRALITSQLDHFKPLIGTRIKLSGPAVEVSANAAQSIGMALHELATNAAKYGALSNEIGEVSVAWSITGAEDAEVFTLSWNESGGPPVQPSGHRGLGSHIITRLLSHSLGAEVALDFLPEGLHWSLRVPASVLIEGGNSSVRPLPA